MLDTLRSGTIASNSTISNYIRYSSLTESTTFINGIALTKIQSLATPAIQTFTIPNGTARCLMVWDTNFQYLQTNASNLLTCSYRNDLTSSIGQSRSFNSFQLPGPPGPPGTPTYKSGTEAASTAGIAFTVTFTVPAFADSVTQNPQTLISTYQITYSTTGDSTKRYGGSNPSAYTNTFATANSTNEIPLSLLFPYSTYSMTVKANNTSLATYGEASSAGTYTTTTTLPVTASSGTLTFSATPFVSARLVSSGSSVNNVAFANPGDLTATSAFINSIHTASNIGSMASAASNLMSVTANLNGNNAASITYGGFSAALSQTASISQTTSTMVSISSTTSDAFASAGLQGYYLNASNTITIKSAAFATGSNSQHTVNVTFARGGTTFLTPIPFQFYYDPYSVSPSINSGDSNITLQTTATPATPPTRQICGIYVVTGSFILKARTSASGLGTHFFNNTRMIAYTNNTSPASETTTANIISGKIGNSFSTTVVFETNITQPAAASFAQSTTLNVNAYAPHNNTPSATVSLTLPMLFDPSSVTLVTSTAYPSPANLSSNKISPTVSQFGCRINSGTVPTSAPFASSLSSLNATTAFDNTLSLVDTNELQICNGLYQTKFNSSNGYLNYSSLKYSSSAVAVPNFDYSTISATGYRFATFSFRLAASSVLYNYIQFTINGLQNPSSAIRFPNGDRTKPTVGADASSVGGTRIYFYYRVEDAAAPALLNSSNRNSIWLDATETFSELAMTSSNFYDTTNVFRGAGNASVANAINTSLSTYTINCTFPSMTVAASDSVNVYFRICAPMNETFAFSSVSSKILVTAA